MPHVINCNRIHRFRPKDDRAKHHDSILRRQSNNHTTASLLNNLRICTAYDRRKFRSQTSDNMERLKAEQGRGREKSKIRREKIREEKESEGCRCAKR